MHLEASFIFLCKLSETVQLMFMHGDNVKVRQGVLPILANV